MVTLPRAARPPYRRAMPWLTLVMATPDWLPARAASQRSAVAFRSSIESMQLQNVVGRADERPFTLHLLEPTQQELPEAPRLLDLANHRFDDRFARRVDGRAGLRLQLAGHAVDPRRRPWQRTAGTGSRSAGSLAMGLLPRRDVGIDRGIGDRGQVRVRAIPGIG